MGTIPPRMRRGIVLGGFVMTVGTLVVRKAQKGVLRRIDRRRASAFGRAT